MNDKISEKDKKDWENFISSKEKVPNKDKFFYSYEKKKIKSLDLHGYSLIEANKKVEDFIKKNFLEKFNRLIIITGKGRHSKNGNNPYVSKDLSILKNTVPEFIKKNQFLMKMILEIKEAEIKDGGSGAIYIHLKKLDKGK